MKRKGFNHTSEYSPGEYCESIDCESYHNGTFCEECDSCQAYAFYLWLDKHDYRIFKTVRIKSEMDDIDAVKIQVAAEYLDTEIA